MREKLLKASAVEAIGLSSSAKAVVRVANVQRFLQPITGSPETVTAVRGKFRLARRENASEAWLESRDGTDFVHRSILRR
jgi:hypothetical protein